MTMKFEIPKTTTISIASLITVTLLLVIFDRRRMAYQEFEEKSEFIGLNVEAYSEGINSILYDQNGEILRMVIQK